MDADLLGAPAAMLHVQKPPLYETFKPQETENGLSHTSSSNSGRGRSRGRRGRGRGKGRSNSKNEQEIVSTEPSTQRLQRPKVNMMARTLAELLEEPKIALMHRVVNMAGPDIAWKTLMETLTIEESGGLYVNADACGRPAHMMEASESQQPRRRTKGGVFLTMLKTHLPKETYKKIFEIETDLKKQRKKKMRFIKHQKMESKIMNQLPLHELCISGEHKAEEEHEDGEIDDVAMTDN